MIDPKTKDKGSIVAEVLMSRAAFAGAHLLVEGPSDGRFWRQYYSYRDVQIVICGGKANVEGSMEDLDTLGVLKVLGIVDGDLDSYFSRPSPSSRIVTTDDHDLETMLMRTNALEIAFTHLGDGDKIRDFERAAGASVRSELIDRAMIFAKLRYISIGRGHHVAFSSLSPWKYIRQVNWSLDNARLIADYSALSGETVASIIALLGTAPTLPAWSVINGHDALDIMTIGLLGIFRDRGPTVDAVFSHLATAYSASSAIKHTKLWASLCTWELSVTLNVVRGL